MKGRVINLVLLNEIYPCMKYQVDILNNFQSYGLIKKCGRDRWTDILIFRFMSYFYCSFLLFPYELTIVSLLFKERIPLFSFFPVKMTWDNNIIWLITIAAIQKICPESVTQKASDLMICLLITLFGFFPFNHSY